jgi:hypothetical protein
MIIIAITSKLNEKKNIKFSVLVSLSFKISDVDHIDPSI